MLCALQLVISISQMEPGEGVHGSGLYSLKAACTSAQSLLVRGIFVYLMPACDE